MCGNLNFDGLNGAEINIARTFFPETNPAYLNGAYLNIHIYNLE